MEHSASLRSLEASGRPSGTGRPSLPLPRNEFSPTPPGEGAPTPSASPAEPASVFQLLAQATATPTAPLPGGVPVSLAEALEEPSSAAEPDTELEALLEIAWLGTVPNTPLPQALPAALNLPTPEPALLPSVASNPSPVLVGPELVLSLEPQLVEVELAQSTEPALILDAQPQLRGTEIASTKSERAELAVPEKEQASAPARAEPAPRAAEILQQMRVNLNATTRSAVIQLSPPELGWITVQIRMEEDKLRTLVRAERPEALEALTRHLPELRATLQQQGIQVNDIQLELGMGPRGDSRDEQHQRPTRRAFRHDAPRELAASEEALLARVLTPRAGGVDTYA